MSHWGTETVYVQLVHLSVFYCHQVAKRSGTMGIQWIECEDTVTDFSKFGSKYVMITMFFPLKIVIFSMCTPSHDWQNQGLTIANSLKLVLSICRISIAAEPLCSQSVQSQQQPPWGLSLASASLQCLGWWILWNASHLSCWLSLPLVAEGEIQEVETRNWETTPLSIQHTTGLD